ncbi:hypothetical protein FGG78_20150 [Thioclava sp. BHET1]|nr:hypothetical protein FGG78_20150 [Thioclava sp. BHET1]
MRARRRSTLRLVRALSDRERRAQDEQALDWLRRRDRGESSAAIARMAGVASARVRVVTQRIRDEDLAQSGEDPGPCYDWRHPQEIQDVG